LKNEIAAVGRVKVPDGDRFIACFTPFQEQASAAVAELQKLNDEREQLCKKVISFVGEDKMGPDELFGHISSFMMLFDQAAQANKEEKEKQERAAKRAAEAAARKATGSVSSPTTQSPARGGDGVMDDLFSSAKSGQHFRRTMKAPAQAAMASEAILMRAQLKKTAQ